MTQAAAILSHLKRHGSITALDAIREYRCFRLAARINDLRGEGHNILTQMILVNDRRFARYSLGGK